MDSGVNHGIAYFEIRFLQRPLNGDRAQGLLVLKPAWALADMLGEEGWGACGLQPDDIEWSEITDADELEWQTACRVFALPLTRLQDSEQDSRGHAVR